MQLDDKHEQLRAEFCDELRRCIADYDYYASGKASVDYAHLDKQIAACPEICEQCAAIFCPHGEPLHFHHDGCPCCDGEPIAESIENRKARRKARWVTLLNRNTVECRDATR